MGANLDYRNYKNYNEKVKERWDSSVEQAGYNGGQGGYSGTIYELGKGFNLSNHIANNENDALEYIEGHQQKWDRALGIRYKRSCGIVKSDVNKQKKLQLTSDRYERNYSEMLMNIQSAFKKRKSKLVGCSHCGSRLNKEYVKINGSEDIKCPLCGNSLLSDTDHKRLANAHSKVKKAHQEVRNFSPRETKKGTSLGIIVGGWCSA